MSRVKDFIAGLPGSSVVPFLHALREVGVTAILALTPVWIGVILSIIIAEDSLWGAVRLNTSRGDLFLLSSAAVAPVLLYVTVKKDDFPKPLARHFPGGWFFILCLTVVFGSSVVLFSVKRLMDTNSIQFRIDEEAFFVFSLIIYGVALLLVLVVTCVKESIERVSSERFRTDDEKFTRRWINRDD
jgi:hypothetical protein